MSKFLKHHQLNKEIAVVVGTRPGIVKFSPIIRSLKDGDVPFFVIHTGQHYSYNMDRQFFEDLQLPKPRYTNDKTREEIYHGAQTAEMIRGIETALLDARPKLVIVGGDANTNLAGALAARKLGINLAHMEAGLRSNDWRMPEEHNRVMIDHISDVLLAPTERARRNLIEDNVKGKIFVVGNSIVDAVVQNKVLADAKSNFLEELGLEGKSYFVLTLHREETVDQKNTLAKLMKNVREIYEQFQVDMVFPIHPRTKKRLDEYGMYQDAKTIPGLRMTKPVGYLDFIALLSKAKIVLTDSGGIQEESCILRVPCITLRENTERPETVELKANRIVGTDTDSTINAVNYFLKLKECNWENPYGDGNTGKRIAKICSDIAKK